MTYDQWKTTEPPTDCTEPFGICDVCDRAAELFSVSAFGIETWACEECLFPMEDDR